MQIVKEAKLSADDANWVALSKAQQDEAVAWLSANGIDDWVASVEVSGKQLIVEYFPKKDGSVRIIDGDPSLPPKKTVPLTVALPTWWRPTA